jgi:hypothetical protein
MPLRFAGKKINQQTGQQAANGGDRYHIGLAQALRNIRYPGETKPIRQLQELPKEDGAEAGSKTYNDRRCHQNGVF